MNNKRFLLLLLLSILFIVLASCFVSAGCCLLPNEGQGCLNTSDSALCSASDQKWDPDHGCYELEECAPGCCCPTGIGSTNYSCQAPRTFIKDASVDIGSSCSCGGPSYTISGTVRDALGNVLSGAVVSARGISNVSLADGTYHLNRVPSGTQVEVGARKDGCLSGTTTIANLSFHMNSIDISLNCVCAAGSCNAAAHAFCISTNNWRVYDPVLENAAYCNLCRNSDPVNCIQTIICQGGDGACPLSCSNIQGSTNFDSDCVCSTTPNGVCPSSAFGCDSTNDADCVTLTPVCDNGIIEYPYETCEYPSQEGQLSLCSAAECTACNCRGLSRCGNLILDPGETCEIGMVCANGSMCENCQCGVSLCSATNLNPKVDANFDYASQRMFVNWSVLNSCKPSVGYYSLYKCEGCNAPFSLDEFSPLSLFLSPQSFNYSDINISGNSKYCYYVRASYMDGRSDGVSAIVCKSTGDAFCINPHTREFCLNNDRYDCDAQNNLRLIKDCAAGYCMPPDYSGLTKCVNQSVCDYCNGLYGMFANLPGLKVRIQGTTDYSFRWCKPASNTTPAVEGCYYDKTRTLFSAFKYCSNVSSCYNYKSKTACEDPDSCGGKTGPCVWNYTQITKPELGGICRPLREQDQQCELCDSKEFNWLSPSCTPEICKLFGNCYFLGKGSWRNTTCSSEKLLTCADYNNSNMCTGGQPVHVDVSYDANKNRISGTHQLTPSNDNLNLGKCYWYNFGNGYGICLRDADGFPIVNYRLPDGWDCDSNDTMCNSDFTNPTTTVLPRSGCYAGGFYGENTEISYAASDDRYFSRYLKTYFCITPQGSTCYPTNLGFNGTYSETMTSSGFYNVYYYSQDPAKNLEVVNDITIEVDAIPPSFRFTNPSVACNLQTTQQTLPLEGVVSDDAMYICAKNRQNNKVVCVNNCVLNNNTQPCISTSGLFTLNIPITVNSALTNITIYTQDRACNYFENTIQATCKNETFPRLRINISGYYV